MLMKYKDFKMMTQKEMKAIKGGSEAAGNCWIHTSGPNGSNPDVYMIFTSTGCPGSSTEANSYCVNLIATPGNGINHCSYNCGCIS